MALSFLKAQQWGIGQIVKFLVVCPVVKYSEKLNFNEFKLILKPRQFTDSFIIKAIQKPLKLNTQLAASLY